MERPRGSYPEIITLKLSKLEGGYHSERDMSTFDTEKFINEIEKRPAIYDVSSNEYSDRSIKAQAWNQVCEAMVVKWRSMSEKQRNIAAKKLKSKWKHIRDYFIKELKQDLKNENFGKERKKYMYFERLLFLKPSIEYKSSTLHTSSSNQCIEVDLEDSENDNSLMVEYEMPMAHEAITEVFVTEEHDYKLESPQQFTKSICGTSVPDEFPDVLSTNSSNTQRQNYDDEDYDRMFLLSLVPIMRRIPEERKLDVRIQIQQLLSQALPNKSKC